MLNGRKNLIKREPAKMPSDQDRSSNWDQRQIAWMKKREKLLPRVYQQFGVEVRSAHNALVNKKPDERIWHHLERAHILSQSSASRHLGIHLVMFCFAIMRCDFREILGQIPRMILAAPSSLFGKAPSGNTGRSNISMFARKPLPKDLQSILEA